MKIEEYAKITNVSVSDAKFFLMSVVDGMAQDNIIKAFMNETEENQKRILLAYVDAAAEKYDKFRMKFLTNDEFKQNFMNLVLGI